MFQDSHPELHPTKSWSKVDVQNLAVGKVRNMSTKFLGHLVCISTGAGFCPSVAPSKSELEDCTSWSSSVALSFSASGCWCTNLIICKVLRSSKHHTPSTCKSFGVWTHLKNIAIVESEFPWISFKIFKHHRNMWKNAPPKSEYPTKMVKKVSLRKTFGYPPMYNSSDHQDDSSHVLIEDPKLNSFTKNLPTNSQISNIHET